MYFCDINWINILKMKVKRLFIIIIALIVFESFAYSLDLPKKTIGNTVFYCYKVQAKETIFGISKKLNISQDDLKKYNPSIINGLKKDFILLIPTSLINEANSNNISETHQFTHIVEKGQTLYGISKTYNVSQESIIALNPSANVGLKTGQTLTIPQPENSTTTNNNSDKNDTKTIFHTIAKGETLFSLSKKYSTDIEQILSLNPGISPTNFKINEVIKITPNTIKTKLVETTVTTMEPYVIQKGDNYKKIAKNEGINVDDLKAANPNIDKIKEGLTIQLPKEKNDTVRISIREGSEQELADNNSERIKEIYDSVHNNTSQEINIALLLPYMLDNSAPSKSALLYTEFYKGLLMAVEELKSDNNINIFTYDTKNKQEVLNQILSYPEMKKMDLIFTSDDVEQLNIASKFCQENKIYLINTFSLKNDNYNTNPYLFQVNVPQTFMHDVICEWFDNEFNGYEVVFIHKKGSAKKDFTDDLQSFLTKNNIQQKTIEYQNILSQDAIAEKLEPAKKYLFIPTSGNKSIMSQILPVVKKIKEDRIDLDISVLGYPEWVTYISDWKDYFFATDTYFYSRFFANPKDDKNISFEEDYKKWYGEEMLNATPRFGYLGYDAGSFFLKTLCKYGKDFNNDIKPHTGLQNSFKFERINNWSGFINKNVYFIHFTPIGKIETTIQ